MKVEEKIQIAKERWENAKQLDCSAFLFDIDKNLSDLKGFVSEETAKLMNLCKS